MEIVELKVRLHCKACEKTVRKALCKIKGVTCVEIDAILNKITVLGYVERQAVIKAIHKTGRRTEVWPSSCHREDSGGFVSRVPKWPTLSAGPTISVSAINGKVKDMILRGLFEQTLKFYKEDLHPSGLHGNNCILPSVIKACSSAQSLHFGLQLHCIVLKTGSDSEPVTSNSLLAMYAKCSHIEAACKLFDTMPVRDTITWNSMINCYIRNGHCFKAIELYKEMFLAAFEPKPELTACILSICSRTRDLRLGRQIHAHVISSGSIDPAIFLSTALVDMYSKCCDVPVALQVFKRMVERNEVSWTAMISGLTANESFDMSLEAFQAMQVEGIRPNRVTLIAVLPACAALEALKYGKEIHGYAFRHGFETESHLSAALIDMYCKCGAALDLAMLVLKTSEARDVVMWSSMIRSNSRNGNSTGAMKLFYQMRMEAIEPNSITLLAVITACATLSTVNHGQRIHCYSIKSGLDLDVFVGNSLIDMYAKCGCLSASRQIFKEMPAKDSVSWSCLIHGYGRHGYGSKALQLFQEMQERQIEPDGITILAVLSACKHAGFIEEGQRLFNRLVQDNKIALTVEHFGCYIDLLARFGKLEEACEVVRHMPMKPSPSVWGCLVSSCKAHGRLEIAEMLANQLIDLEPENPANYTLLSTIYSEAGNWANAEEVWRVMRMRHVKKSFGFSRIEI